MFPTSTNGKILSNIWITIGLLTSNCRHKGGAVEEKSDLLPISFFWMWTIRVVTFCFRHPWEVTINVSLFMMFRRLTRFWIHLPHIHPFDIHPLIYLVSLLPPIHPRINPFIHRPRCLVEASLTTACIIVSKWRAYVHSSSASSEILERNYLR